MIFILASERYQNMCVFEYVKVVGEKREGVENGVEVHEFVFGTRG